MKSWSLLRASVVGTLFFALSGLFCREFGFPFSQSEDPLTFSVVGDVMCHDPQLAAAWNPTTGRYSFAGVFDPVAARLSRADLTIANLETTLPGDRRRFAGYPEFGSPDELAEALKTAGVDVLTLSNNHSLDKGKSGLIRTIEVVQKLGFAHLGTYRTVNEWAANRVLMLERKGLKLALLNYTYGTNGIAVPRGVVVNQIEDGRKIAEDLALARTLRPDAIIVLYHYGAEYIRQPDAYQRKWTDFAFEHGADIVLGGHPHVVQPFEVKTVTDRHGETKERLVIYSLGNFVSNQQRRYTDGGVIFNFSLLKNPDGDSPQRVIYRDIGYEPIWVFRDRSGGRLRYHVIPADDYVAAGGALQLDAGARARLKVFYDDITAHLAPSVAAVERYRSPGVAENR